MPKHLTGTTAAANTAGAASALRVAAQAVPQERCHTRLSPHGRTPLEIVAHCATMNLFYASLLEGSPLPFRTEEDRDRAEAQLSTSDAGLEALAASVQRVLAALETIPPDRLGETVQMPWGESVLIAEAVLSAANHMRYHEGQLHTMLQAWGVEDV